MLNELWYIYLSFYLLERIKREKNEDEEEEETETCSAMCAHKAHEVKVMKSPQLFCVCISVYVRTTND